MIKILSKYLKKHKWGFQEDTYDYILAHKSIYNSRYPYVYICCAENSRRLTSLEIIITISSRNNIVSYKTIHRKDDIPVNVKISSKTIINMLEIF